MLRVVFVPELEVNVSLQTHFLLAAAFRKASTHTSSTGIPVSTQQHVTQAAER